MQLLVEGTIDATTEKHLPVVQSQEGGILVKVGEIDHPMEDTHYIEWIEVIDGDKVYREYLSPGHNPQIFFPIVYHDGLVVKEYCNLHGVWTS
jgi:superoxide reductase